jgi:hypothetical protein
MQRSKEWISMCNLKLSIWLVKRDSATIHLYNLTLCLRPQAHKHTQTRQRHSVNHSQTFFARVCAQQADQPACWVFVGQLGGAALHFWRSHTLSSPPACARPAGDIYIYIPVACKTYWIFFLQDTHFWRLAALPHAPSLPVIYIYPLLARHIEFFCLQDMHF